MLVTFRCGIRKADNGQAWVCVMFAALNIDRGNISNATSDNILDDLGMSQADYVSTIDAKAVTSRRSYTLRTWDRQSGEWAFCVRNFHPS